MRISGTKKNKFCTVFMLFMVVAFLSGCQSQKTWQYSTNSYTGEEVALLNKSVSVPPLADARLNENSNMAAIYMIPLMPYGWQDFNTPEGVNMHLNSADWKWRPNEDIAKATAEELDKSGVFKEVFFTNRASEGDLVLQGTIKSTKYNGKIITYGLSVYGPMLWLLGLPATSIDNELSITFQLKAGYKGEVLWEKDYKELQSDTSWIYSLNPDFNYSSLLKNILTDVVLDLKEQSHSIKDKINETEGSVSLTFD